jgi:hypothetical protein
MSNHLQIEMLKVMLLQLQEAEHTAAMSKFDNLCDRIHEVSCLVELELDNLEQDE